MSDRVSDIRARLRQLERELARLERFPDDDDFADGTIIRFRLTLKTAAVVNDAVSEMRNRVFTYAALKVAATNTWWITGQFWPGERAQTRRGLTYDELRQVMVEATDVRVFTGDGEPLERGAADEADEANAARPARVGRDAES